jgi:RNA polymerase sigma-70 factor (subfamily 1)
MLDELTTQVLVAQAKEGSNEAIEALCRRYQQRVLAAVRLRLGTGLRRKVESWDLVQEAMIDAFQRIRAFDFHTEGAFLRYVNQIVENRIRDAADHWEAQRRDVAKERPLAVERGTDGESPAFQLADSTAATPSRVIGLQEDLAILEQAMDILGERSPDQKELLIAVKLECCTYSELASQMGISEDAVRMRTNRALDSLSAIYRRLVGHGDGSP